MGAETISPNDKLVRRFVGFVFAQFALIFALFFTAATVEYEMLPPMLQMYEQDADADALSLVLGLGVLLADVVALAGMLRLRHWSRVLFLVATVAGLFVTVHQPTVMSGLSTLLGDGFNLNSGLILALAWFSPLAGEFNQPGITPVRERLARTTRLPLIVALLVLAGTFLKLFAVI